jgi:hypothetical protein
MELLYDFNEQIFVIDYKTFNSAIESDEYCALIVYH